MDEIEPKVRKIEVIGFGRRFFAIVIDGAIVVLGSMVIAMLIGMIDVFLGEPSEPKLRWDLIIPITMLIFSFLYYTGKWVWSTGYTPGKITLGIRIVNADGAPLTFSKVLLRYFGYILSGIVASLGFIWAAIDKEGRGWHDMIAKTYVISIREKFPVEGEVTFVRSESQKGWLWIVLWVLLALGAPAILFSSLWFLGPVINKLLNNFFGGLR